MGKIVKNRIKKLDMSDDKRKVALLLAPLALLLIGGFILGLNIKDNQTQVITTSQATEVLGVSLTENNVNVEVHHIKKDMQDSNLATGTQKLTVNLTVSNNGSVIFLFSPGLDIKVKDAHGNVYEPTAKFLSPETVIGGPINSGKSSTLDVDFEVPNQNTALSLVFRGQSTQIH
jgi:Domain of unknown function (DUF4352)